MFATKTKSDIQVSQQSFDAIMMLAIATVEDSIGSAPTVDMLLFDEAHEAYCAEILQSIIDWKTENNQDRLFDTNTAQSYDYAKREALIKVAEIKLYNALHKSDCINEGMI